MARSPILFDISWASQVVPAIAYLATPHRTRAGGAIALGAMVSAVANVVSKVLAAVYHNNMVVSYISSPVTALCFFYALHEWQLTAREQRVIRVGMWVFLPVWVLLVAFVEDVRNFTVVTGPLYSLTLLVAATWTLMRRANATEVASLFQTDWFWVTLGIAVYGAATAASEPIGGILLTRQRLDLFYLAWQVRAVFSTLSYLMMSWGIYRGPLVSRSLTVA